ncbi:Aldo-keto reductase family 1 member B10 [Sarcoptes scabiei]|uniref:Aldo-keto reductase family 1 member B10 n=1 Tax=Sarcoptes scabiei TaxID=52283 RepID=A0A834VCN5_SARSC|nr:Aldo-keto reductase family 1 member B10 [Sarcoptes scabiei]UXI18809.1 Choline/ethanolaminephosphotransferase 1 [Sarcoptes scabiei]
MVNPESVTKVKFNNGKTAPAIGLGTWQSPPDGSVYRAVKTAIECGYRHLDCAYIYMNHKEVGQAIADSIASGTVTREDLFITSKIWMTFYRKDRVPLCMKQILEDLNLTYLDLTLIHWPMCLKQTDETEWPADENDKLIEGDCDFIEAYQSLENLVDQGLTRSIGVSNFNEEQIERLLKVARIVPVCNQVESTPYLSQESLRAFCAERSILLTAYSPLGNPGSTFFPPGFIKKDLLNDPLVLRLAEKYKKNAGQILLRYHIDRGMMVMAKSTNPERIKSNIDLFDFELDRSEIEELSALNQNYRTLEFHRGTFMKNYPF